MPTFYDCQRCTACCRWPGQVRINDAEISAMAGHLGMAESDFIERFTRIRPDRRGLSLRDKENGECAFLDGENCRVQPAKPQQCRDFPNLWRFDGFESKCQAKAIEIEDEEEYRRRIVAATGREPFSRG
ncbi:MAG: YkgJ family cysteine cluster protein [Verrucomicrobiae bacterium]|nr:YkgJ family cysteine cluster protein [Verrucomicrobiae bacterium]